MDDAKRDAGKVRETVQAFRRLQEADAALVQAIPLPLDAPERRAVRQACVAALDVAARNLPLLTACRTRFGFVPCPLTPGSRGTPWDYLEEWAALSSLTPGQKMELEGVNGFLFMVFCQEEWIGQVEGWADALEAQSNGKELPWEDDAPGFVPLAEAVRYAWTQFGLSWTPKRFRRLLTRDGPVQYMPLRFKGGRGGRCNVHLEEARDFFAYVKRASKGAAGRKSAWEALDAPVEIVEGYLEDIKARKAQVRQEKQARGERPNSRAIPM